jgi:hypothetical protein
LPGTRKGKALSVISLHFFASSTVIAVALRDVGNCARQTNASAMLELNFVDIVDFWELCGPAPSHDHLFVAAANKLLSVC